MDENERLKMLRKTQRYAKAFAKAFLDGKVEKPSNGDCWYCLMVTEDGRTLGEAAGAEHILSHIDEKYYVPSLMARALGDATKDEKIGPLVPWIVNDYWYTEREIGNAANLIEWQLSRAIRIYIRKQLGIGRGKEK